MKKIKIGIVGLGTVGKGVYEILQNNSDLLTLRSNCKFEVVAVSSRSKKNFVDSRIKFYENPIDLAQDPNIDIVVELIGGFDVAKEIIFTALRNNKKIVTANKALLAEYGKEIADEVDKYNGIIGFEASVAGANPIIKSYKESFISNEITEIYGILNGTCNFILTKMFNEKQDYKITLKEAQNLGYAEANPTFDVAGNDTAHKIILLCALANQAIPNYKSTYIEGIENISIDDINLADEMGYKIKLLGVFKKNNDSIFQAVYPALINKSEKIAQIDGVYNAILTKGSNFEYNFMVGRGAGGLPTGSSVVADIVDVAFIDNSITNRNFLFNADNLNLQNYEINKINNRYGKYFINFTFNKNNISKNNVTQDMFMDRISIDQLIFKDSKDNIIIGGIITNNHKENEVLEAISLIDKNIINSIKFIRIEQTNF